MKQVLYFLFALIFLIACAQKGTLEKSIESSKLLSPITVEVDTVYYLEELEAESQPVMAVPDELMVMEESFIPEEFEYPEETVMLSGSGDGSPASEPISQPTLDYVIKGDITYVMQDSMVVGEISIVDMTVSKGMTHSEIVASVESFSNASVVAEEIRVTPTMRAKLIDPSTNNFRIVPITPDTQIIEPNGYTLWKWNVTPLVSGVNPLLISVDIIVGDNSKSIEVYEGKIQVISNETSWDKFVKFLNENWKYLLSTLIIPFGIFVYSSVRKRNKKDQN